MPLSIKNDEAERLARQTSDLTGETLTQAVLTALSERLERLRGRARGNQLLDEILEISTRCAALPDRDSRSADEILGYDEHGAFGGADGHR